jgi:hypothetical protein
MIEYRKVVLPPNNDREWRDFAGSTAQRTLHNKLVDGLRVAQEKLEATGSLDEVMRQQGQVQAFKFALALLHEHTSPSVKEQFYV